MRDRDATRQYRTLPPSRRDNSQRNLLIGVGVFVAALALVGALLLTGRGDDDGDTAAVATNTRAATSELGAPQSMLGSPTAGSGQGTQPPGPPTAAAGATATATGTTDTAAAAETPTDEAVSEEPTEEPVAEEPEPTEPPVDEPEEEPVVGDFGQLPPVQIVSGGLSRSLDLSYEIDTSTYGTPDMASVYSVDWYDWTVDEVTAIAASLGINGTAEDLGAGSVEVIGDNAELYAGPTALQYVSYDPAAGDALEDDGTLVATASAWLTGHGIIGSYLGDGAVIGRDETSQIAVVQFKPTEPSPLLAFWPSASVTLAPGGVVREADIRWPGAYAVSDYSLRSLNSMWNDVLAGEGAMEGDLSALPGSGPASGTFTVTDVGLAYSYASGDGDYLVPLVVFYGEAYFAEYDTSVPLQIYVTAVAAQDNPAG